MYAGKIVETGPTAEIMERPRHPYTAALLDAVPAPGLKEKRLRSIKGQPPDPVNLPSNCSFAVRCSKASGRCLKESPTETKLNDYHYVSCFHAE